MPTYTMPSAIIKVIHRTSRSHTCTHAELNGAIDTLQVMPDQVGHVQASCHTIHAAATHATCQPTGHTIHSHMLPAAQEGPKNV